MLHVRAWVHETHGIPIIANTRHTVFVCFRSSSQRNVSDICDEVTMKANPAYGAVEFDGKIIILWNVDQNWYLLFPSDVHRCGSSFILVYIYSSCLGFIVCCMCVVMKLYLCACGQVIWHLIFKHSYVPVISVIVCSWGGCWSSTLWSSLPQSRRCGRSAER